MIGRPGKDGIWHPNLKGAHYYYRRTEQDAISARQFFEEAINLDPNSRTAYISLGFSYLDEIWFYITESPEKSIEHAEQAAQKCTDLSQDQPPPYGLLSSISLMKKDFDNAILFGEKAVKSSPNDSGYYLSLGMALRSAGRYEEAIVSLETALRLNPLRPLPYVNNLGWACLDRKQYDKAILL